MPSKKSHNAKNKSTKSSLRDLRRNSMEFRDLLLSSRKNYSKGRAYDAVDLQKKALSLGKKIFPRFEDNSVVKAHALLELGLVYSAVCTDFATGDEWTEANAQFKRVLGEAMDIFTARCAEGTLAVFRAEEWWISGGREYQSPVPHTERLGPVDFLTCANMALGCEEPSAATVSKLKYALRFGSSFRASGCVVTLADGIQLQGDVPELVMTNIENVLREHERRVAGGDRNDDFRFSTIPDGQEEARHTGTRLGEMKLSKRKLASDVEKKGLRCCARPDCGKQERQPRQFSLCSRCQWKAYCGRECQKLDWKRHKREECSDEKRIAAEKKEYQEQRRGEETLLPGQIQQFMTVVRYLHAYFLNSPEIKALPEAPFLAAVLPTISGPEDYHKIEIPQLALVWNSFWNMDAATRGPMLRRFATEMASAGYSPESMGGPPFAVALEWNHCYRRGTFAVVEHTSSGTIFLHETDGADIVAYRVKGISQSVQSILDQMKRPLPLHITTTLIPFKGVIVTDGTITDGVRVSPRLQKAAATFASGTKISIVTTLSK
mmetsp:Transcript_12582/g.25146  ORF Transcript_12582/g.25146 Transcript_12582/m.25146 type:complete len:548 (-) Transcript_12582:73-1716(-)|eukprot:CAMPEP_0194340338 /NCGR_PEP_ID=MMETSP0171-20130528/85995_1 /TAXON_ID=218684 /ORGANISM="Corethron pennatum, Strain L29A3" /LENGTH=547 /DNA_ID=CAMNT_0039105259 /DNA_START=208 /DNA_END=1851 /DNA_ORIENTATION=-